jgi:hypothetical protein
MPPSFTLAGTDLHLGGERFAPAWRLVGTGVEVLRVQKAIASGIGRNLGAAASDGRLRKARYDAAPAPAIPR